MAEKPILCSIMGGGCGQLQSATGVLMAMDDCGIIPDKYLGSSAGACIAGLRSSGLTGWQLSQLLHETSVSSLFKVSVLGIIKQMLGLHVNYLYDNTGAYRMLQRYMTDDAAKKTKVALTKAKTYQAVMLPATPQTVLGSAAIPQIFQPVQIDGTVYVDGGVKNMIPVPKIHEIDRYKHIYIILCPRNKTQSKPFFFLHKAVNSFLETKERQVAQLYQAGWDDLENVTVIQPPPIDNDLLGWSKHFSVMQHAYRYGKARLRKAK